MPFKHNAARRHRIPPARCSDFAIELVLSVRLVFHLALRQAEEFARSVLALLGTDLAVPDHTALIWTAPGRQGFSVGQAARFDLI